MKHLSFGIAVLSLAICVLSAAAVAQDTNPVHLTIKRDGANQSVKQGDKFSISLVALIDQGWHLYSPEQPSGGPIPTRISVPENKNFQLAGDIENPVPQTVFDPNFNLETQI